MSGILRVRRGIPRFARKLLAGEPSSILAFGTSLTVHTRCGVRLGARYLDPLVPALQELSSNGAIELINNGLEGFGSWYAMHRVRSDIIPKRPDLVIVELAHNDHRAPPFIIPQAMHSIVGQIQRALPECEIVSVLFAPQGIAAKGPSEQLVAHEAVADYYGFPSFDLAALCEELVAGGRATWTGDPRTALTREGTHHSALVTELVGRPFADAFADLVRYSLGVEPVPVRPAPPSPLLRSNCIALDRFADGRWLVGPASDEVHCNRNGAAYRDEVVTAKEPGATIRFRFSGQHLLLWALLTGGAIRTVVDGTESAIELPHNEHPRWDTFVIAGDLPDREHTVELTASRTPLMLGDLYFVGDSIEP